MSFEDDNVCVAQMNYQNCRIYPVSARLLLYLRCLLMYFLALGAQ